MNSRIVPIVAAVLFLVSMMTFARPAEARTLMIDRGGVYSGDVWIAPGQVVQGDVTVFAGTLTVEGEVDGDVNVIGGSLDQLPGSVITGQTNVLGDEISRGVMPWAASRAHNQFHLAWNLLLGIVVLVFFLIFPTRTRMALDRLEKHPGLCAAIGLVGWVAVVPLALVLLFTIVLIPLIVVEAIAVVAGVFIGTAALSLLIGRRLYEMLSPQSTPTPLVALALGIVLLTAAQMVPYVGYLVTALVCLVGLGAAILAFVRESTFAGTPPPPQQTARPTISGPPMTLG